MSVRLDKTLERAGHPAARLPLPDGGQAIILPHGGRVIGLYAAGSDENFLWTSAALRSSRGAAGLFASDAWCNTGGDRTWLAPENDFFCPEYPSSSTYSQPRQLDPGRYRCQPSGGGIRLTCDLALHSHRTREDLRLRIVKDVEPAGNPFHQAADREALASLRFAGYTLRTTLEVRSGGGGTVVGLWHLLQLPHGGRMLVPTRFPIRPTVYFGRFSKRDLIVGERMVEYVMRSPGEHKIGVSALALTGRAGYLRPGGKVWTLVVRNFSVNPSGCYVDTLPNAGACPGDAFQACNVSNAQLGHFSELEYHVPAIGGATGLAQCADVSQVWAFRGRPAAIRRAAALLLGPATP